MVEAVGGDGDEGGGGGDGGVHSASDNTGNHCQPCGSDAAVLSCCYFISDAFILKPRAARPHLRSLESCVCTRVSVFCSDTQQNSSCVDGGW